MKVLVFDSFTLHLGRYELTQDGRPLPLPRISMEILIMMLQRNGDLLRRDEIAAAIWPGIDPADVTQSINNAVNRIRSTLRDDPIQPRYIQTVIGKGYRFIAAAESVEIAGAEPTKPAPGEAAGQDIDEGNQTTASNGFTQQAAPVAVAEDGIPVRAATGRRSWIMVAALLLAVLLAAWFLWSRNKATPSGDVSAGLKLVRFTDKTTEDRVTAAAISPDGGLMAYADADGVVLEATRDAATHALRAPSMNNVDRIAWFPDGLHLALSGTEAKSRSPEVWVVSVVGEEPRLLRDDARLGIPSPDGSLIAFTNGTSSEVWVSGLAGEAARRVVIGAPGETFPAILWSKNGKSLLMERHATSADGEPPLSDSRDVRIGFHTSYLAAEVSSGKVTASVDGVRFGEACLLPDGQLLFARNEPSEFETSTSLWTAKLDPNTGNFVSKPERIQELPNIHVEGLSAAATTGDIAAVFKQGQQVVYIGSLHWPEPRLEDVRRLSLDASIAYPHGWTSDSSAVLFEAMRAGRFQIFRQRLDRHDPETVVTMAGEQVLPRLSPDGNSILFVNRAATESLHSLFRVPLQGGNPVLLDTGAFDEYRCPRSGKTCVLRTLTTDQRFIYSVLDPVSGRGKQLFVAPWIWNAHGDWDVSPDGTMVALISPLAPSPQIRLVSLSSGRAEVIPVHVSSRIISINWALGKDGWFVGTPTLAGSELFYVDAKGKATLLRQTASSTWGVPSPDGRKLAFVDQNVDSNVWILHADDKP